MLTGINIRFLHFFPPYLKDHLLEFLKTEENKKIVTHFNICIRLCFCRSNWLYSRLIADWPALANSSKSIKHSIRASLVCKHPEGLRLVINISIKPLLALDGVYYSSSITASVWLHWLIKACDLQQLHRICRNMAPDEIISVFHPLCVVLL